MLVDPHDQNSIAEALLKLVSDRNLWMECRVHGLNNINYYSWPQHCRIYLARIDQCRMRHPHWQDNAFLDRPQVDDDFQRDSLKGVHTHLSIDDKALGNGSDLLESQIRMLHWEKDNGMGVQKPFATLGQESSSSAADRMLLRRKAKRVFVIAIDCYDSDGQPGVKMLKAIQEIITALKDEPSLPLPGFILSTAMTLSETITLLNPGGFQLHEFDALICGSGSRIYYPDVYADSASMLSEAQFCIDQDYSAHIEYRWGGEGIRKSMAKIMMYKDTNVEAQAIMEDEICSNEHCLAYKIKDPNQALRVEELRRNLRMRGLRCHVLYCKNETKLHILPLFASRAQALRYLFVRWGTDLSNMFVFVGETGDSDYEGLLSGIHKTIILKGCVDGGSERLLRSNGSYHKEDMVPFESPNMVATELDFSSETITNAFKKLM